MEMAPSDEFGRDIQLAQAFYQGGRFREATDRITNLVRLQPFSEVLYNFAGAAHAGAGEFAEAIANYDKAIALNPDYAEAYSNRAAALRELGRFSDALESCEKAIQRQPDLADAHSNRGVVLKELGRLDEAVASYDIAIRLRPGFAAGYYNRANVLRDMKQLERAVESYDQAIQLKPDHADAYSNRGNALQEMRRPMEALDSYEAAIRLRPAHAEAFFNRGNVLAELKRLDEAAQSYAEAVHLNAGFVEAQGRLLFQRALMCQWDQGSTAFDTRTLGVGDGATSPFGALALEDDAGNHLKRSKIWAQAKYPCTQQRSFNPALATAPIRIGYFSADFHDHATMYLMAKLFETHDKNKFEVHAFSYGPDRQDGMRQRLRSAVSAFHDVRHLSDKDVADLSISKGIDIAVDLKGYTQEARSGIFAYRAAPVQINYLGYPGSMGVDFMDYIMADDIIIPEEKRKFYSEKILSLPESYQINDDSRYISEKIPERSTLGLPNDGFVFCCFNNNFKIMPDQFDLWMRLLRKVDGSVLWLLRDNRWAEANLRSEAFARGVDPNRLVFADRASAPDHLARHACADLFLDTFNYNAHTTASDALWAGLPIITRIGDGFAARVAASLLSAMGLPELITKTDEDYTDLALDLATNPARLAAINQKLAENRRTAPLFDTEQCTRNIEHAYELVHGRFSRGETPDHCRVPMAVQA
jgi:predicted O-linked N-acetylglucosamine transferase (SPINDLY family)